MRVPLSLWILVAMLAGAIVGPVLGVDAAPLGELGKVVIQLIKAVAAPLLFLAIVHAVATTDVQPRDGARLLGFATLNASVALALGLLVSNVLHPGLHLSAAIGPPDAERVAAYAEQRVDWLKTVVGYVPSSFVGPFVENAVLSLVILAVLVGAGLRSVRAQQLAAGEHGHEVVTAAVATGLAVMETILGWVVRLVPLAVFAVVAKTVGEYGFAPLRGLAAYLVAGLGGLALHVLVVYSLEIRFWARIPLARFWEAAREPVVTALGTNSSLATLPVTLRALDRLGVSRASSTLGACVGTNFNNDGILLYEGMAVLFVAQASGLHLTLGQQVTAALTSLVAAMGVAGVPEAGFVSLALVLNAVGIPVELLPLLLTVDWVIARARSVVNVLSDMVLSILLDRK